MFERFTEAARRTIFFAREEAERLGYEQIETDHLLLGIFAEEALTNHLLGLVLGKQIRSQIEESASSKQKSSTDAERPLSEESKQILNLAAAEADRLEDKQIGNQHLLLGVTIQPKCRAARLLVQNGMSLETVRERVAKLKSDPELAERIRQTPPRRIDWSEFGIPDGYAYPKLLYNPASETLIIQLEGVDELRPKRLYMKHKDASRYERVGSPDDTTSYEDPVVSLEQPLLAFNVTTWEKHEQGVGGDWKELRVLDLKTRLTAYSVKKGELILPEEFDSGWISDLHALSDDGPKVYVKAALQRASRSKVTYALAVLDLPSKRLNPISVLQSVFF